MRRVSGGGERNRKEAARKRDKGRRREKEAEDRFVWWVTGWERDASYSEGGGRKAGGIS